MGKRPGGDTGAVLALLLLAAAPPAPAQLVMGASVNPGCINMRISYHMCGIIPYPCATMTFWQPKWIVDVKAVMTETDTTHYHFHHVLVRPITMGFEFNDPCAGCAVPTLAALTPYFYKSLTDPLWRAGQAPVAPPHILAAKVGLWGGLYPRCGFLKHTSPVVASGLAATRGFDIAREPIDLWPGAGVVRPTIPLVPNAQTIVLPCMQLNIPPAPWVPCHRAGFDFATLMTAPAMPGGIYQWIIWKRKVCTLPLPLNWCATALDALPKWNWCF